ncbi:MAG: hypothetical protein VX513_03830 [Pseudomonadota bacterium]|nr:hypothetical protein [Pseudomonadota bacterium]
MPSPLAGTAFKHPTFKNVSLFAQPIKGSDAINWYTRVTFPKKKQSVRSLKLPYIPNDANNKTEAVNRATTTFYELDKRHQQGLSNNQTTVFKLIDRFLEETKKLAKENMGFINSGRTPPHFIAGGKTPLNQEKYMQIDWVLTEIVKPFFKLPKNKEKTLDMLTKSDIESWSAWRIKTRQKQLAKEKERKIDWANGTLNKQNRVLRTFFKWSVEKGYLLAVPQIRDFQTSLKESRRPEMSEDQYQRLIQWLRDGYTKTNADSTTRAYRRLFYLYICTLDATGIRPFDSAKNALKWKDIKIAKDKAGNIKSIIIDRKEKGISYQAVADKQWFDIYNDIKILHQAWDMKSEYLFAHPKTVKGSGRYKDAPIGSFAKQWKNAVEALGFAKKGDKQQNRVSRYSIRHRYALRRYMQNKDVSLEELSKIMGSAPSTLFQVYWHYQVKENYERLMTGGYEIKAGRVRLYDDYGIVIKTTKRNSKTHIDWYKRLPRFTEPPTEE